MKLRPRLDRNINTRVTQIDYERMESQAGQQTVSEWARDILLKQLAGPDQVQVAMMAELWALRYILINGGIPASQTLRELVDESDAKKVDKAVSLLTWCRR